jgi:hypothetical protein
MKMKKTVLFVCAGLILWWFTAGCMIAFFQAEFPDLTRYPRWCRENTGMALLFGLLPPAWLMTPFMTGGLHDGWTNPIHSCDSANASLKFLKDPPEAKKKH